MQNIIINYAAQVINKAIQYKHTISTAESCTGGMLSMYLTAISGSSKVFDCGYITYSNRSKNEILNIDQDIIQMHGAVSYEVAVLMAGMVNK